MEPVVSALRTSAVAVAFVAALLSRPALAQEPATPPRFQATSSGDGRPLALAKIPDAPPPPVSVSSPAHALRELRNAVSTKHLPRFTATLTAARLFADRMPLGAERNSLRRALLIYGDFETAWKFADSNSAGSFYDEDTLPGFHDHLSADYPPYARFIDELKIFDHAGRAHYPTAETRSFLLAQLAPIAPVRTPVPPARIKTAPAKPAKTAHAVVRKHPAPKPSGPPATPVSRSKARGPADRIKGKPGRKPAMKS
ncbi:MAG: hypothetical protein ABIP63_01235, partial [Thermoanaerobaculia bacterium]